MTTWKTDTETAFSGRKRTRHRLASEGCVATVTELGDAGPLTPIYETVGWTVRHKATTLAHGRTSTVALAQRLCQTVIDNYKAT